MSSTLVGCFVLFVTRGFRLRTILSVVAALAVVYVIAVGVQSNGTHFNLDPIARLEQTTGTNTGYNTVNPRVATIEHSWSGIVQSPIIGHGLDQTTISVYYDPSLGVYYPAHNIVILYWFAGGIFMLLAMVLMMGSSFNRLLHGRLHRPQGPGPRGARHRPGRVCRGPVLLAAVARDRGPLALAAVHPGAVLPRRRCARPGERCARAARPRGHAVRPGTTRYAGSRFHRAAVPPARSRPPPPPLSRHLHRLAAGLPPRRGRAGSVERWESRRPRTNPIRRRRHERAREPRLCRTSSTRTRRCPDRAPTSVSARSSTIASWDSTAHTCSWSAHRHWRCGQRSSPRSGAVEAHWWTPPTRVARGRTSGAWAGPSWGSTSRTRAREPRHRRVPPDRLRRALAFRRCLGRPGRQ